MAKISLFLYVTLFTCLPIGFGSARATPSDLHKRHHIIAERALHGHAHLARSPLKDAPDSIALNPRIARSIGKRDGAEYALVGCFSQLSTDGIDLLKNSVPWNMTTIQTCVESCYSAASSPYPFAGVLSGNQCRCDSTLPDFATQVDQSNCRSQCASGDEQWCGGQTAYQIYHLPSATPVTTPDVETTTGNIADTSSVPSSSADTTVAPSSSADTSAAPTSSSSSEEAPLPESTQPTTPTTPSTLPVSNEISYNYVGCYEDTEEQTSRVLRGPVIVSSSMTPVTCATYCSNEGYPYAGLEADQCICGATLFATANSEQCTQACTGDSTLTCGAPLRVSVYLTPNASLLGSLQPLPASTSGEWSQVGCYIDDINTRAMEFVVPTVSDGSLSVDACTDACKGFGHSFAGLELTQCFCSDASPTLQADAHDCDAPCPVGGGSCGGGLRLDVYKLNI